MRPMAGRPEVEAAIRAAIEQVWDSARPPRDLLYGDGTAGPQIAEAIAKAQLTIENSCGRTFLFVYKSPSFLAAGVEPVAAALEPFVNAAR